MGVDLSHTRVNGDRHTNGTAGGYTPASPVNHYHPLWDVNGGPGSELALVAHIGGTSIPGAEALGMVAVSRLGAGRVCALGRVGVSDASGGGLSATSVLRTGSYSGPEYGVYEVPMADGAGIDTGSMIATPGGSAGSGKVLVSGDVG